MNNMDVDTSTREFWNELWAMEGQIAHTDDLLIAETADLTPGRALEVGCGTGANAVWLAEQGWTVTAVDFSDRAIAKAKRLAKKRGVDVEFVLADASEYEPVGEYDLITSFYIHLWPEQRRKMLDTSAKALAVDGSLLFVGHDKSNPPSGWSEKDLRSLTSPEMIAAELAGLKIEKAIVYKDESGAAHMHGEDGVNHESDHRWTSATVVRAARPAA